MSEITITFTAAAEPAGEGFVVLTPAGVVVEPEVDVSSDQRTFTLTLDEALVDGTVGVRWSVRAGDAHPIEGSFSFTTTAPSPTPTPVPTATPAATPTPSPTASPDPTPLPEATQEPTEAPPITEETAPPPAEDPATSSSDAVSTSDTASPVDLDTFLDTDSGGGISAADAVGFVGRMLTMVAALILVGSLALMLVLATPIVKDLHAAQWIVALAIVLGLGVLVEGAAFIIDDAGSVLEGQTGVALGLRLAGAVAIAIGTLRKLAPMQVFGAAATLGSFAFDGHTVTEGNRYLTSVTDIVHAGAAAIWIGGIVLLLVLRNSDAGDSQRRFADFAARFSVIATFSIAAVGLAGVALTATIVDSVSDIWATTWGQTLIAKSSVVAVAMALGAYNHFTLVPAIRRDDAGAAARLGRVLRIEVMLLLAVAALTALLVVAQT